jgi:hypothetical protein
MDVAVVEVPVGDAVQAGWLVAWSGAWLGALGGLAATLLGGLLGIAWGAFPVTPGGRIGPEDLGFWQLAASVCVAFFSFVIGGWISARVAGAQRAEPAILQGAIAWLVAVPLLLVLVAFGVRGFAGWYGGLAGSPIWASPGTPIAAEAAREAAGGAATALLLGLVGAVLGGWMASGEPMSLRHYRRRGIEGGLR